MEDLGAGRDIAAVSDALVVPLVKPVRDAVARLGLEQERVLGRGSLGRSGTRGHREYGPLLDFLDTLPLGVARRKTCLVDHSPECHRHVNLLDRHERRISLRVFGLYHLGLQQIWTDRRGLCVDVVFHRYWRRHLAWRAIRQLLGGTEADGRHSGNRDSASGSPLNGKLDMVIIQVLLDLPFFAVGGRLIVRAPRRLGRD